MHKAGPATPRARQVGEPQKGPSRCRFYLAPEPLVVFDGRRQQVQRELLRVASGDLRKAIQLSREFGRNLQVREASVGCRDIG